MPTAKKQQLRAELRQLTGVHSRRDSIRLGISVALLIIALFMLLSMISNLFTGKEDQANVLNGIVGHASNYGGKLGAYTAYYFMNKLFGVLSIFIPIYLLAVVLKLMLKEASPVRLWLLFIHFGIIMVVGSVDANFLQDHLMPQAWKYDHLTFDLGGQHGKFVLAYMEEYVGEVITGIILLLLTISYIGYWFTQVLIWILKGLHQMSRMLFGTKENEPEALTDSFEHPESPTAPNERTISENQPEQPDISPLKLQLDLNELSQDTAHTATPAIDLPLNTLDDDTMAPSAPTPSPENLEDPAATDEELSLSVNTGIEEEKAGSNTATDFAQRAPYDPKLDLSRYLYPPLSLLAHHDADNAPIDMSEQNANKERIIRVLSTFDVAISAISATIGPTVTLYEITPAPGVRIAKIRNLEDDIALSLSAIGIRIIAPIPGKGTIGIEVPNRKAQIVSMESIINTQKFKDTKFELPIALGKTITNEVFMVDLAKMPHLLVAGATGQGKSVGLNAIITSLLYKKHPAELKLVMVDPKKVEFSMYNPLIKHFLAQIPDSDEPVITDTKKVVNTLRSLCQEMDDRYLLLKNARCKNIKEYNAKFIERRLSPEQGHRFLPYIVVVIDEYGDLIMTAGKDIELPIARIAQLARAVGMHMVIATQSPRAEIITGKIKANFPARMAFRVMGSRESSIILDEKGANNLIGRGDMLILTGGNLTRVQCAFVDTPEVEAITDFIAQQQGYPAPYELPLVAEEGSEGSESMSSGEGSTFENVARFVVNTQQGSTSKIQRTFSIGFNRAGRLMDQLEEAGIVGPVNGSKPREVYVQSEIELQQILDNLKAQGKNFE